MNDTARKKWFMKKASRRVFRTKLPVNSSADEVVYLDGQIIRNKEHAEFLFDKEKEFALAGTPVTYFRSSL